MSDSSPDHNSNTNEQLRNIVNNMQKQIDALTSSQTSSKRPTPQQGIDTSPQRDYYEEEDEDMEFNELDFDEELELYASQNEDFENEIEENTSSKTKDDTPSAVPTSIQVQNEPSTSTQDDDIFSDIRIVSTEEDKGEKIKDDFARIILDSYNSKKDKENIKKLRQSYPLPENCNIPVPKLNVELWQLLNSFQRKSDVSMAMIQRNLISALSGAEAGGGCPPPQTPTQKETRAKNKCNQDLRCQEINLSCREINLRSRKTNLRSSRLTTKVW
ncbi:putative neugrin-like protein DDB_G0288135 [Clytia hemisphaerica]|uniref:putative neugrin-like protein DDB_G0288135 n=1 Tax=Clytia hemisphaerica TaxID=252671 RepID=UPI0034D73670